MRSIMHIAGQVGPEEELIARACFTCRGPCCAPIIGLPNTQPNGRAWHNLGTPSVLISESSYAQLLRAQQRKVRRRGALTPKPRAARAEAGARAPVGAALSASGISLLASTASALARAQLTVGRAVSPQRYYRLLPSSPAPSAAQAALRSGVPLLWQPPFACQRAPARGRITLVTLARAPKDSAPGLSAAVQLKTTTCRTFYVKMFDSNDARWRAPPYKIVALYASAFYWGRAIKHYSTSSAPQRRQQQRRQRRQRQGRSTY